MVKKRIINSILKTALVSAFMVSGSLTALAAEQFPTDAGEGTEWTDDNGIVYECLTGSASTASPSSAKQQTTKRWAVKEYKGNSVSVDIPDEIPEKGSYNFVTKIDDNAFSDDSKVKTLKLPTYLTSINPAMFDGLTSLERLDGNGSLYATEDGILYSKGGKENPDDYKLIYVPSKLNGDIKISEKASGAIEGVNAPFNGVSLNSIEIPASYKIMDEETDNGYSFTFYGAQIGRYLGANTKDGSLFDSTGKRLIAYGKNSNASLAGITDANPYAFYSYADLSSSDLPDSVKKKVPFVTYAADYNIRHFTIDGKTAYCYNMGKKIPQTVEGIQDYDNTIAEETLKNKITLLLFAAAPNDGLDIAKTIFGDSSASETETLKNATGSLVWEFVEGGSYTADSSDVYGADGYSSEDVDKYISALRDFANTGSYDGKDYKDKVLNNFKLGFYPAQSADVQGLIVITDNYHPAETGSYRVDKEWDLNYTLGTPEELSAYVRLYRTLAGTENYAPVGDAVKLTIKGEERKASYTWNDLELKDANGTAYVYKAYEVKENDHNAIYDGKAYTSGRYTYSATFNYKENSASFINVIDKKRNSGGGGGDDGPRGGYSGWDGPNTSTITPNPGPKTPEVQEIVPNPTTPTPTPAPTPGPTPAPEGPRTQPKTGDPIIPVLMIGLLFAGSAIVIKKRYF